MENSKFTLGESKKTYMDNILKKNSTDDIPDTYVYKSHLEEEKKEEEDEEYGRNAET